MANVMLAFFTSTCVLGFINVINAQGVDKTLQEGASGSNIVQVVVNRITAVFGNDNIFLRRVAYVESKDGTDPNTYRRGYYGGIWQVDEIGFRSTQDTLSHHLLFSKHSKILQNFSIDWSKVQWKDLQKPLYSGIAARLFISNDPYSLPCDIQAQARYLKRIYNRTGLGTEQKFISDVGRLNQDQACKVNSEVFFVLDTSGSIGTLNFEQIRQFVIQFINRIPIGPMDNQVGVIVFNSTARLVFDLNRYNERASLTRAVEAIAYTGGSTNIPAGLCELYRAYSSNTTNARSDSSVFRIAIFMTDGQSNRYDNPCGFRFVQQGAKAIHSLSPPVLVFAFGVGSSFSSRDLQVIASGPDFISSARSFDSSQLRCVQAVQEDNLCYRVSTPVQLGSVIKGSLQQGEQIRWQFDVPNSGSTFSLKVNLGKVQAYASTKTTAPNDALYEWKIVTTSASSVRIKPAAAIASSVINGTVPVYFALSGIEELNNFNLRSDSTKLEGTALILMLAIALAMSLCSLEI